MRRSKDPSSDQLRTVLRQRTLQTIVTHQQEHGHTRQVLAYTRKFFETLSRLEYTSFAIPDSSGISLMVFFHAYCTVLQIPRHFPPVSMERLSAPSVSHEAFQPLLFDSDERFPKSGILVSNGLDNPVCSSPCLRRIHPLIKENSYEEGIRLLQSKSSLILDWLHPVTHRLGMFQERFYDFPRQNQTLLFLVIHLLLDAGLIGGPFLPDDRVPRGIHAGAFIPHFRSEPPTASRVAVLGSRRFGCGRG